MHKRGQQVIAFILIGISILVAVAVLISLSNQKAGVVKPLILSQEASFTAQKDAFQEYVTECMRTTTKEGIDFFGLKDTSQQQIAGYIGQAMPGCVDFERFNSTGLDITSRSPRADVKITPEAVLVSLTYPLHVTQGKNAADLSVFSYNIKRENSKQIQLDSQMRTTAEQRVVTDDGDAELYIPRATIMTDAAGKPVRNAGLTMLDRNFEGLNNGVVLGMVAYEGTPDGLRFDPEATLRLRYDPEDLPAGFEEELLTIGWWDSGRDLWWGLPSTVDTANHVVSAQISHFTSFALVSCTQSNGAMKDKFRKMSKELMKHSELSAYMGDGKNAIPTFTSSVAKNPDWKDSDQASRFFIYTLTYLPLFEQTCGLSYKTDLALATCYKVTASESNAKGWEEKQDIDPLATALLYNSYNAPKKTMATYGACIQTPNKEGDWDADDKDTGAQACHCSEEGLDGACKQECKNAARNLYKEAFGDNIYEKHMSGDGIKDTWDYECETRCAEYDGDGKCARRAILTTNIPNALTEGTNPGLATPAEYGYSNANTYLAPGGWARIDFKVGSSDDGSKGDGCIMVDEKAGQDSAAHMWLKLRCSGGDLCGYLTTPALAGALADPAGKLISALDKKDKNVVYQFTSKADPPQIRLNPKTAPTNAAPQAAIAEEAGIKGGRNKLYVKIDNGDLKDSCVWAEGQLVIEGLGIDWEAPDCTVLEALYGYCEKNVCCETCENRHNVYNAVKDTGKFADIGKENLGKKVSEYPAHYTDLSPYCNQGTPAYGNDCAKRPHGSRCMASPNGDPNFKCGDGWLQVGAACPLGQVCCRPDDVCCCPLGSTTTSGCTVTGTDECDPATNTVFYSKCEKVGCTKDGIQYPNGEFVVLQNQCFQCIAGTLTPQAVGGCTKDGCCESDYSEGKLCIDTTLTYCTTSGGLFQADKHCAILPECKIHDDNLGAQVIEDEVYDTTKYSIPGYKDFTLNPSAGGLPNTQVVNGVTYTDVLVSATININYWDSQADFAAMKMKDPDNPGSYKWYTVATSGAVKKEGVSSTDLEDGLEIRYQFKSKFP